MQVTLTLSRAVAYGEDGATVSYTPGTPPLRDLLGNSAAAFSNQTVTSEVPPYDTDTDGLIEITTVAQLNAMRYDLDGRRRSQFSASGSVRRTRRRSRTPARRCAVLTAARATSCPPTWTSTPRRQWNSGRGWEHPSENSPRSSTATFEGNGHTIANLYVNRTLHEA